jgi:hypothetical protein
MFCTATVSRVPSQQIARGHFDLSERGSISIGIFHTRRPEKVDTGGGVATMLPAVRGLSTVGCSEPRLDDAKCLRPSETGT